MSKRLYTSDKGAPAKVGAPLLTSKSASTNVQVLSHMNKTASIKVEAPSFLDKTASTKVEAPSLSDKAFSQKIPPLLGAKSYHLYRFNGLLLALYSDVEVLTLIVK